MLRLSLHGFIIRTIFFTSLPFILRKYLALNWHFSWFIVTVSPTPRHKYYSGVTSSYNKVKDF